MDLSAAPTSQRVTSLSKRLKAVVRGVFTTIDVVGAAVIFFAVLVPILIGMQIMRMKQWAEDDNEEM